MTIVPSTMLDHFRTAQSATTAAMSAAEALWTDMSARLGPADAT